MRRTRLPSAPAVGHVTRVLLAWIAPWGLGGCGNDPGAAGRSGLQRDAAVTYFDASEASPEPRPIGPADGQTNPREGSLPVENCRPLDQRSGTLFARAQYLQPRSHTGQGAGHFNELHVLGDVLMVANGQDAFLTLGLPPDGTLRELSTIPADIPPPGYMHCSTVAAHLPSHTVYCGFPLRESPGLALYDLRNPADTRFRSDLALRDARVIPRRLRVIEDTLYIAAFQSGLLAADIAADGSLSGLRNAGVTGDIRAVDGDARRLVVLDQLEGLKRLEPAGSAWRVAGTLALPGPRLSLRVVGDEALAALGSEGGAVVDLRSTPPREVLRLRPPAVVTSMDRSGEFVALGTVTGLYLYRLRDSTPALVGFAPSGTAMLDVRFHQGDILVADFQRVHRFGINPGGATPAVDVNDRIYFGRGTPRFSLRNLLEEPVAVEASNRDGNVFARFELGAREVRRIEPGETPLGFSGQPVAQTAVNLALRTPGGPCQITHVQIGRRSDPTLIAPLGIGDPMPPMTFAVVGGDPVTVPSAAEAINLVFHTPDCTAMWPTFEDLNYLASVGRAPFGARGVLLSRDNAARVGLDRIFALSSLRLAHYSDRGAKVPEAVRATVARYGDQIFDTIFSSRDFGGVGSHPTVVINREGTVEAFEIWYRGAYSMP